MPATTTISTAPDPHRWVPWRLEDEWGALVHVLTRYEVDLKTCLDAPQILDWIAQIARKPWADDATLAGLVRALDDILRLQENLCGSGYPGEITPQRVGELVTAARAAGRRQRRLTSSTPAAPGGCPAARSRRPQTPRERKPL